MTTEIYIKIKAEQLNLRDSSFFAYVPKDFAIVGNSFYNTEGEDCIILEVFWPKERLEIDVNKVEDNTQYAILSVYDDNIEGKVFETLKDCISFITENQYDLNDESVYKIQDMKLSIEYVVKNESGEVIS